uniref:Immunoglobulin V-set domain-containing protein n=1 Tax=Periophthalmus magnuspinnatus TaxID=409849 RepID=A0A3B4A0K0_9GOBI
NLFYLSDPYSPPGLFCQSKFSHISHVLPLSTDYKMVGHVPVEVEPNKDAILPCHVEPEKDLTNDFVEWYLTVLHETYVVYRYNHKMMITDEQNNQFKNRTEILKEDLTLCVFGQSVLFSCCDASANQIQIIVMTFSVL